MADGGGAGMKPANSRLEAKERSSRRVELPANTAAPFVAPFRGSLARAAGDLQPAFPQPSCTSDPSIASQRSGISASIARPAQGPLPYAGASLATGPSGSTSSGAPGSRAPQQLPFPAASDTTHTPQHTSAPAVPACGLPSAATSGTATGGLTQPQVHMLLAQIQQMQALLLQHLHASAPSTSPFAVGHVLQQTPNPEPPGRSGPLIPAQISAFDAAAASLVEAPGCGPMGHSPHLASGGSAGATGIPPLYPAAQRLSGSAAGDSLHPAGPSAGGDGTEPGAGAATTAVLAAAAAGELPPPRQESTFSGVNSPLRPLQSCPASALGASSPPAVSPTAAADQAEQPAAPGPAAAAASPLAAAAAGLPQQAQQHGHGHSAYPPGAHQGPSSQNGVSSDRQQHLSAGGSQWAGFASIRPGVDGGSPGPVSVDLGMGGGKPTALQCSAGTAVTTAGVLTPAHASVPPDPHAGSGGNVASPAAGPDPSAVLPGPVSSAVLASSVAGSGQLTPHASQQQQQQQHQSVAGAVGAVGTALTSPLGLHSVYPAAPSDEFLSGQRSGPLSATGVPVLPVFFSAFLAMGSSAGTGPPAELPSLPEGRVGEEGEQDEAAWAAGALGGGRAAGDALARTGARRHGSEGQGQWEEEEADKGGTEGRGGDATRTVSDDVGQLEQDRRDVLVFPDEDDEGEDGELEVGWRTSWWKKQGVLWFAGSVVAAAVLVVVGMLLQCSVIRAIKAVNDSQAYRWLYFVAGFVPVYWIIWVSVDYAVQIFEWYWFREHLYYLQKIQSSITWLITMLLMLIWFQVCFYWLWCEGDTVGGCKSSTFRAGVEASWKVMLCLVVFCLAEAIKAVTAKLTSTHFYRTAHFKKFKRALEKEYYLQLLSVPRSRIDASCTMASGQASSEGAGDADSGRKGEMEATATAGHLRGLACLLRTPSTRLPEAQTQQQPSSEGTPGMGAPCEVHVPSPGTRTWSLWPMGRLLRRPARASEQAQSGMPIVRHAPETRDDLAGEVALGRLSRVCKEPAGELQEGAGDWGGGADLVARVTAGGLGQLRGQGKGLGGLQGTFQHQELSGSGSSSRGLNASDDQPMPEPEPLQPPAPPGSFPPAEGQAGGPPAAQQADPLLGSPARMASASSDFVPHPADPNPSVAAQELTSTDAAGTASGGSQQAATAAPSPLPPPPTGAGGRQEVDGGRAYGFVSAEPFAAQMTADLNGALDRDGGGAGGGDTSGGGSGATPMVTLAPGGGGGGRHSGAAATSSVAPPRRAMTTVAGMTQTGDAKVARKTSAPSFIWRMGFAGRLVGTLRRVVGQPSALGGPGAGEGEGGAAGSVAAAAAGGDGKGSRAASGRAASGRAASGRAGGPCRGESKVLRRTAVLRRCSGLGYTTAELPRQAADLGAEAINAVPLKHKKAVHEMTEDDLSRMRTAIVIKTYTALIRKHSAMSPEEELRGLRTVKRFAKAIFLNLRGPDTTRTHVTRADFDPFFPKDPDMAQRAFEAFDLDRDGQISGSEIRDVVVSIYTERCNMARALKDTDSIVRSLELSLGAAIHFLFCAIYLTIWGVPLLEGFSAFSATVLALTFIFGKSAEQAFQSVLFLFFQHPYDVGDMVVVRGEAYRVKRISLMYTDLVKWTNEELYAPNTTLVGAEITNWTRSLTKFEMHKLLVDVGVAWEVKQDIEQALVAHCAAYPQDFDGAPGVTFREVADPMKVSLGLYLTYNFPPDDFDKLVPARDKVVYVVQQKLAEHRLRFSSYDVNSLDAAAAARALEQLRCLQAHESGSIRLKGLSGATAAPAPQYGSGGPYGGSGRTASSGFGAAGPRVARGPGGSGTDVGTGIVQQGGGVGYGGGGEVGQAREELLPRATLGAGGRLEAGAVAGGQLPAAGAEGLQHRPVGGLGSGAVQGGGQGSARELRGAQEERGGDKSKKE